MMHYGNIKYFSIENGIGIRVSLFVSGCRNHCKNCFSTETWDFDYGLPFDDAAQEEVIEALKPAQIAGLTILGGEPFEPENQPEVLAFIRKVREACPEKTIWMYTGFVFEELTGDSRGNTPYLHDILSQIDILVDGRFEEEKKNLLIRFRGSENQRIIDMPKTLEAGHVVLAEEYMNKRKAQGTLP